MPKGRGKIDIKKARAKMLGSLQADKKQVSFFSKFKNQFANKPKKAEKVNDPKKIDLLAKQKERTQLREKRKAELLQVRSSLQKTSNPSTPKAQDEEASGLQEKSRQASVLKREKSIAKEKKLAIKQMILTKRKQDRIAFLKAKQEAKLNAKKRKEELALNKKQDAKNAIGTRSKAKTSKSTNLAKAWVAFTKRRQAAKKEKLEREAAIRAERERYLRARKKYKKEQENELSAASKRKTATITKSKKAKQVLREKEPQAPTSAWKNFLSPFKKVNQQSKATKQKLHYLRLERDAREARKKKNIEEAKNLIDSNNKRSATPALKKPTKAEDDQAKNLIKLDKKELEKKKLIPEKKSFWNKLTAQDTVKKKGRIKKDAKKELEKKAQTKAKEEDQKRRDREKELRKIKWATPDILRANLIRGQVSSYINWKKNIAILVVGVAASIGIIAGSYQYIGTQVKEQEAVGVMLLERIDSTNNKIDLAKKNINTIFEFQKKIELVGTILENHTYWTEFFKFLEDGISEDVYIHQFSGDLSGVYSLAASTKDYNTAAEQIKSLRKNEKVSSVSTGGATAAESEVGTVELVNFNIDIQVDTNLFKK